MAVLEKNIRTCLVSLLTSVPPYRKISPLAWITNIMGKMQQPLCEHEDESHLLERTELEDRGTVVLENNLEQIQ